LTQLLVQGKDSNAALPLHPHPAPVYHAGKIQALSHLYLAKIKTQEQACDPLPIFSASAE
jgi:hypothetical protein